MNSKYRLRAIYKCVRDNGPITSRRISELLGIPIHDDGHNNPVQKASDALCILRRRGLVQMVSRGYRPEFMIVPGTKPPSDQRGKSPNCHAALREYARANAIRLHTSKGHHPRPIAKTALEQAWGWLPSASQGLSQSSNSVLIDGGKMRPEQS